MIFVVFISRKLQLSSVVRISLLCPVTNQLQSRGVLPCIVTHLQALLLLIPDLRGLHHPGSLYAVGVPGSVLQQDDHHKPPSQLHPGCPPCHGTAGDTAPSSSPFTGVIPFSHCFFPLTPFCYLVHVLFFLNNLPLFFTSKNTNLLEGIIVTHKCGRWFLDFL